MQDKSFSHHHCCTLHLWGRRYYTAERSIMYRGNCQICPRTLGLKLTCINLLDQGMSQRNILQGKPVNICSIVNATIQKTGFYAKNSCHIPALTKFHTFTCPHDESWCSILCMDCSWHIGIICPAEMEVKVAIRLVGEEEDDRC